MTRMLTVLAVLTALSFPQAASAYLNPEDVLLSRDMFLPPQPREATMRTDLQAQESAARREREQQRAFSLQHPAVVETQPELEALQPSAPQFPAGGYYVYPAAPSGAMPFGIPGFGAAPSAGMSDTANLELMRTMRLLSRVNENQALSELQKVLHTSADDLAPTGAGSMLAAGIMLGAVFVTMRRARNAKALVQGF